MTADFGPEIDRQITGNIIGATRFLLAGNRRYRALIATSDVTALRGPIISVPKISVKILHFLVFFCFARFFPRLNLILAATSLQSSDICFLPIIMAAVECINEPQVYTWFVALLLLFQSFIFDLFCRYRCCSGVVPSRHLRHVLPRRCGDSG